jgi:hypothetical protein
MYLRYIPDISQMYPGYIPDLSNIPDSSRMTDESGNHLFIPNKSGIPRLGSKLEKKPLTKSLGPYFQSTQWSNNQTTVGFFFFCFWSFWGHLDPKRYTKALK